LLLILFCRSALSWISADLAPMLTPWRSGLSSGSDRKSESSTTRGVGQVLAYHVNWIAGEGLRKGHLYLPHDGVNENNITGKRYEDHWDAGFNVEPPVKNQGKGAAMMRLRRSGGLARNCGSTKRQRKPGAMRWASTTKRKTKTAMLVSVLIMIGRRMLRMRSA
jgi:hypothetical protein